MRRLRIGVLIDGRKLAAWQAEALRTLSAEADFWVYSCNNSARAPRRLAHAAYYLLNLAAIRNRLTRRVPWPADLPAAAITQFRAIRDGSWQELPAAFLDRLRGDRIDVIVKFGMGLLRVPPADRLAVPILSYHHGDPAAYRGRPAGFYEMLGGDRVMGQVVQRLSNQLDAGPIVASAFTKVAGHSYRSTLVEAYRHSPLILARAIANALAGSSWQPRQWGRNYRLPSNRLVLAFLLRQWRRAVAHLCYGLFKEKRWHVATAAADLTAPLDAILERLSQAAEWRQAATPPGYRFLADPFFHPEGGLLVEGFNERSCRGEILHVSETVVKRLSGRGGHYSYPATLRDGSQWTIIPEVSEWSPALSYALRDDALGQPAELHVAGRPLLLDPTPFSHDGRLYLFANRADEGPSVLRLWSAVNVGGEFVEHPDSPILISPRGARMAGHIFHLGGQLFRAGQDFSGRYGDGTCFFRIMHIDRHRYAEEPAADFRFDRCRGPHTLNFGDGRAAFDFYEEHFNLLAGLGRLKERRAAGRSD